LRNVIDDLIDRLSRIGLPPNRPSRASVRKVISDVANRATKIAPLRRLRSQTTLANAFAEMPKRFEDLRLRLRTSRLGRSADGIIVLPLLGIVLVLGIFTATAATNRSSAADSDFTPAALGSDDVRGEVVTQTHVVTVTTPGKKKLVTVERTRVQRRVVKRPGEVSTVLESVSVPGPSHTKTVTGPTKTVTQVVTEVVTSVLTVTETVKKKH
jgi:hypothetical protein